MRKLSSCIKIFWKMESFKVMYDQDDNQRHRPSIRQPKRKKKKKKALSGGRFGHTDINFSHTLTVKYTLISTISRQRRKLGKTQ
ncbi:unnamed protein product [Nesidiocoris tenuis]|uniref:Uncharacterized protein n=1 Tax=Nesidiocoris tenuis TaxID=355587 RepID=A0A6H5H0K0_9HEMI|nr:unnamed protein product [Nesidiocoris tenuis]